MFVAETALRGEMGLAGGWSMVPEHLVGGDECCRSANVDREGGAVHTRCCRTCRWYVRGNSEQGSCSNPQMVTELGFSPAVRDLELHCRRGWNNDLWQASPDDLVLEIRTKQPDAHSGSEAGPSSSAVPIESDDVPPATPVEPLDRVISLSVSADR
jgi:hypothetical protein